MRSPASAVALALVLVLLGRGHALAQDDPPPIGPFVIDLRASVPGFPGDQQLADSRVVLAEELPGRGFGLDVGAHIYPFRLGIVTFGVGGQLTLARARSTPAEGSTTRAVTARYVSGGPQLSLNFGTGDGWSYLSGGIALTQWSTIPDGRDPFPGDTERLRTVNYGGGARWFAKPHLAFTFDVRFHDIDPGTPALGLPGSPRTRLVILGAGLSIK